MRLCTLMFAALATSFVLASPEVATAQQNGFGGLLPQKGVDGKKKNLKRNQKNRPPRPAKKRTRPKRKRGVRAMFTDAQKLYDAQKYVEAIGIYDAILKRYSAHEPSLIQLAKSYYRLDRIKDAYTIFARIRPQGFDAETSYEYGWSFYKAEQWEGALYGFSRVPKGHALYDLANYYGGICAIRLRRYEDAEELLERAVVLPDKLSRSRKLYLKYVATLQLLKQKSELDAARRKERELLQEARKSSKDETPKTAETAPPDDSHQGKKSVSKGASITSGTDRQAIDYHGFKSEVYESQYANFSLLSGFQIPIPQVAIADRKAAAGIQFSLGAEDRNSTGTETRVIIDESQDDLTRVLTTDPENSHEKYGEVSAGPWIEFPLPGETWLALGGSFYFKYPDFERGGRSGSRKAYLDLAGTGNGYDYSIGGYYSEVVNEKTEPIITVLGGKGKIGRSFEYDLSMSVAGKHELYDYLIDGLSGPDSASSVVVNAGQGLPWGFKIYGDVGYQFLANNTVFGLPTFGQASADGQTTHAKIGLSAAPAPWVSAKIEQLFQQTRWTVDPDAATEVFELNVPDVLDAFTAEVSLNLSF